MRIRNYVAAVGRRWLWVTAAGVSAAALAVGLAFLAPDVWRSTATLHVGATSAEGADGAAFAALVPERVLPSLVELARSPVVLESVVDRLDLATPAHRLADHVDVVVQEGTSIITVSASAATASQAAEVTGALVEELADRADELFASGTGSLLAVTVVAPAEEPRWPSTPDAHRAGLLGLAGGAALAAVACGLADRVRPRVRTDRDVERLTAAPVLGSVAAADSRRPDARTAGLDRLRWVLGRQPEAASPTPHGRLFVTGTSPGAEALATDLGPLGGRSPIWVPDVDAVTTRRPTPDDSVLLVVEPGRITERELHRVTSSLAGLPAVLAGVVVDGVLPRRPGPRAWLLAVLRGRAPVPAALDEPGPGTGRLTGTALVTLLGLLLLGLSRPLPLGSSTGLVAVVGLLPLWIGVVRRARALAWLMALAGLGLVCGALLARAATGAHDFARYEALATALIVVTAIGAVGLLLWARTVLPLPLVVLAVGLGSLVDGILRSSATANPFKYHLTVPVTLVTLAFFAGRRRPVAAIAALGALALANLAFDARSAAGFCVLAAALVAWQAQPVLLPRGTGWRRTAVTLGLGAAGAYTVLSELLLSGLAGAELQARTATQLAQSGSLLLGGRPEWTATWALIQAHPLGFGLGTVPSAGDIAIAKDGMSVARIPTAEGYIENYMFAGRFELHSIVADLWTNLGLAGLLLGLAMAGLLVQRLSVMLQRRQASALVCFLGLNALWALAFGPLPTDVLVVALALGVLLPAPTTTDGRGPVPAARRLPAGPPVPTA